MRRAVLSCALVVSVAACGGSSDVVASGDPAAGELTPGPLSPPAPEAPQPALPAGVTEMESLATFDAIVGTTEMIGLGETVHTSGGYHRVRDRLVRHMIEDLGFRAVALETPWREAEVATKYVETCQGSPREAAKSIFGVFASVEMAELFGWMCQWNEAHPTDKVSFWGYDVQEPWADGALLRAFAPGEPKVAALEACLGVKYENSQQFFASQEGQRVLAYESAVTEEQNIACKSAVADARAWLATKPASREVRFASLAVDAIEANQGMYYYSLTDTVKSFESRDRGMAHTLLQMRELRSPGQRVAVIAHNTHLAHAQDAIDGFYGGAKCMGQLVRELHASYEAIALAAYEVHIDWGSFEDPPLANGEDAVERILHDLGKPALLVDLRQNAVLTPGKVYELQAERMIPANQFRALVFLESSEKMQYARW